MEQEEKNNATIKIMGNEYIIKGASPKHLIRVAEYVDNIMKRISKNNRHMSKDKLALLTSINLADEVLRLKEELQRQNYMHKLQMKKEQLRERHRMEQAKERSDKD